MVKWLRNLKVLALLLAMVISAGVVNANAAGFDDGHRFGADIKLTETLGLSSVEQMALTNALATYGPAVKTAMQSFQAARVQLRTDLNAASPVGSQLAADDTALASAKAQLKAARTQLDSALSGAPSPALLNQLQEELFAQFQSRLDQKTGRLLFGYAMHLKHE
jgi:hypothetical protein